MMKAIAIIPGKGDVQLIDIEEPTIAEPSHVKLKVLEVGICGTDREEAEGGRADAPPHEDYLVIGHEMFGQVAEVGEAVKSVQPGDYGVFIVRRGCGKCYPCLHQRSDMCLTGEYTERGIKEHHGFQTEYVVDYEEYLVKVPDHLVHLGVLTEPMSISAKAIDEAQNIQPTRLPGLHARNWLNDKKVLVAGLGAIGLLAAFALELQGAKLYGLDVVDESSTRPQLLKEMGGEYIDGRKTDALSIDEQYGHMDLIFEATGIAELEFQLIDALGVNGIYVLTGIPAGKRPVCILGASLMRQMVLKNQILLGSVNASLAHYAMAIEYLDQAHAKWKDSIERVITTIYPYTEFKEALSHHKHSEIKTVLSWNGRDRAVQ